METSVIIAIALAVAGIAVGILQSMGKAKYAKILTAVIAGVEAGSKSLDTNVSDGSGKKIKDEIKKAAELAAVDVALSAIVSKVTNKNG